LPNYFLDTSALAKRYHKESGSEYVDCTTHHFRRNCGILEQQENLKNGYTNS